MTNKESVFKGGISVKYKCVKWELQNFAVLFSIEELVKDQILEFDTVDSSAVVSTWRAWLSFEKPTKEKSDSPRFMYIKIGVLKTSNGSTEVKAKLKFQVLGKNSAVLGTGKSTVYKHKVGNHCRWRMKKLREKKIVDNLVKEDGSVLIKIDVKLIGAQIQPQSSNQTAELINVTKTRKAEILQCISEIGKAGDCGDVKLVSKDDKVFYAYRWILSSASEFFRAMFSHDMVETNTGVVSLEMWGKTVALMLHFIYTGNLDNDWGEAEIAEDLIVAADKYQITGLKIYLDIVLGSKCTLENAAALLKLANQTGLQRASQEILKFVKENIVNWESLTHFTLSNVTP